MNVITVKHQNSELRQDFLYKSFSDLSVFDQRYLPRWYVANKAFYRGKNENVLFRTQTRDLTFEGVSLYVGENVHVNDRLDMKINLSLKDSFQVKGVVLWKKFNPVQSFAGILFDPLSQNVQELILNYGLTYEMVPSADSNLQD